MFTLWVSWMKDPNTTTNGLNYFQFTNPLTDRVSFVSCLKRIVILDPYDYKVVVPGSALPTRGTFLD